MEKKLYRSGNKMLGGVCAGISEYLDLDSTLIRILWAIIAIFTGIVPGIIVYIICWIIIPLNPAERMERICPECNSLLEDGAKYCSNCGTDVSEVKASEVKAVRGESRALPVILIVSGILIILWGASRLISFWIDFYPHHRLHHYYSFYVSPTGGMVLSAIILILGISLLIMGARKK